MKSDVQLNLRAKESQRALIDAAAEILLSQVTYRFHSGNGLPGCRECDPSDRRVYLTLTMSNMRSSSICLMHRSQMIPLSKTAGKETSVGRVTAPEPCPLFHQVAESSAREAVPMTG